MKEVTIESLDQLYENICDALISYPDCTLSVDVMNIVSSKINNNLFITVFYDNHIVQYDIIDYIDKEMIKMFVKNNIINNLQVNNKEFYTTLKIDIKQSIDSSNIDFYCNDTECIDIDMEGYYDIDFIDDYLTKHNRIRILQEPIKVDTIKQLESLFKKFMISNNGNKLIVSYSVYVPSIDHVFKLDLTFDKFCLGTRTMLGISVLRPDCECNNELIDPNDKILEFKINDKRSIDILIDYANDYFLGCFERCGLISDCDIEINVYSNIKLI